MRKIEYATLLAGVDIPFYEGKTTIHVPTFKEIAMIGETGFYTGCGVLLLDKETTFSEEDKKHLEDITNFEIIMSIMTSNNENLLQQVNCVMEVLDLLFPNYDIQIQEEQGIVFLKENSFFAITKENFEDFTNIVRQIFCLTGKQQQSFKPVGDKAKEIAEKIQKGREKVAKQKHQEKETNILAKYVSILAVGEHKNIQDLCNLTIFQLQDEFERFQLKTGYDVYLEAKMAGAQNLKDVDDWMKDLHSKKSK